MNESQDKIIQAIINYHNKYNKLPTSLECGKLFPFSTRQVKKFFGTWNNALLASGMIPNIVRHETVLTEMLCSHCQKIIIKFTKDLKRSKSGRVFCDSSCAAKYNNTHKTTGTRKSKLEVYLASKIREDFPDIILLENNITAINAELDLYFPELNFAVELNGIFHYEPIYGQDRLSKITNRDQQKIISCYEKGIELCVIDTSKQLKFTEKSSIPYYNIIKNILLNIM